MDTNTPSDTAERLLCSRNKKVDVFLLPGGRQLRVVAEMQDSVHHLRIDMVVNQPSLRIKSISCDMPSIPDQVCRQARDCFDEFVGQRVGPGLSGKLKEKGPTGCTHLANLFHDACYNLTMAQSVVGKEELTTLFPELTEAQMYNIFLFFRPELRGSCIRYTEPSPFMEMVNNVSLPGKVQRLLRPAQR